jgi:hypothetical protein
MKQPDNHRGKNPLTVDRWDPYRQRDSFTPDLDDGTFKMLCGGRYPEEFIEPSLFIHGCLDAPRDVPLGSTKCVTTLGGWCKESYSVMPRECHDYKAWERADELTSRMLKQILEETEDA